MTAPVNDAWYEAVDHGVPLMQGELIPDCPVIGWADSPATLSQGNETEALRTMVRAIRADVIVMTQACDLAQNKVRNVILCPLLSLSAYKQDWERSHLARGQNPTSKAWKSQCDDICDGFVWNLSMLNAGAAIEGSTQEVRIVDFHDVFSAPRQFVESLVTQRGRPRQRLLPPYREHLSQAFARYFMRVGLPINISRNW